MNEDVIRTPIGKKKTLKDHITTIITKRKANRWTLKNYKVKQDANKTKATSEPTTQLKAFQRAMKLLIIIGQLIGLNPVQGILEADVEKIRFSKCYWRFLYCMFLGILQAMSSILCLNFLIDNFITIRALSFFTFYTSTCVTTLQFIHIGTKWPKLMKDIAKCNLEAYIDSKVKMKCFMACIIILTFAIIEHLLSINVRIWNAIECYPDDNMYEKIIEGTFPWLFNLKNMPMYIPVGVALQIMNTISTLTWNYSDVYIVCISIYLASILEQINVKIISASKKHYLPSSYWRFLREDYNRATKLIRSFDDVFSGIIFTCFANNLFFICLQLFNILMNGIRSKDSHACPNFGNGPFGGYHYAIYLLFSTMYLFTKSLNVSLMASSVNTASLVPASALYSVPSTAFCDEVARFITQVNGNNIALSGLQFFYVTRELVLSVAGTVVTYELVLLQFSPDKI